MVKKRGLGKSLDALLAYMPTEKTLETDSNTAADAPDAKEKFCQLVIDQIEVSEYQPRRHIDPDALEELASSIRAQGIIQPIVVRATTTGKYEIIAGERRWRAAALAGLTEVPVLIREVTDESALALALIENIQRENLNPIEEGIAFQRLIDEFGLTHQQIAESVGKSRTTVTNLLRLLALPEGVKNLLQQGLLEMGHVRTLLTLPEALQLQTAEQAAAKNLSVREMEDWVRRLQTTDLKITKLAIDPDIERLQDRLSKQLRLPVTIRHQAKGRGKLIIQYRSLAELDKFLAQLETA